MANKIGYRILLCPVAMILLCAALTDGLAQQCHPESTPVLHHHPVSDQPQAPSGREQTIEMNIPISGEHSGESHHDHAGAGRKTFKVVPGAHLHLRMARPPIGSSTVGRNAIGLPIARHDLVQGEQVAPFARPQTQPFGLPSNRTGGFANGSLPVSPSLPIRNRGTIGGVPLTPRRAAGLGGPSTPVDGINGTAVRLKY
jgi:hypothetical protein